jgi:solute carrier family 35 (GDP-fucose transporter), member C1
MLKRFGKALSEMANPPTVNKDDTTADSLRARQTQIALVVTAYFIVSISLVVVNKVLLSAGSSIPAPLFVTWFQCIVTVLICFACGEAGKKAERGTFFAQFPVVEYNPVLARQLAGLSGVFVAMMTFNNLSLKYVEVSFYNVARSLTIVFNVVLTYFMLKETTSRNAIFSLLVVVVGFFVGSSGEMRFSLLGTFYGVVSSIFVSLYSVMQKKQMALVDGNVWKLSAYNNINACIMFIPFIVLTGELEIIYANFNTLFSLQFWIIMVLSGFFGFLIGIVTTMQIKATSALTHNISGTAKACVQTVLAFWIWQNPTSAGNILGIVLVLAGSLAYAWVRNEEMKIEMNAKANAKAGSAKAESVPLTSSTAQEAKNNSSSIEDTSQDSNRK